jgi:dihydroorotase-like cyclic amidohydrolase
MPALLIRNARLVNEGRVFEADLLVRHGRIDKIAPGIAARTDEEIDAAGQWLLPGWSPFTGRRLRSRVATTVVSGRIAWHEGQLRPDCRGQALSFLRDFSG